jgi:tol-pal system protein YbgF
MRGVVIACLAVMFATPAFAQDVSGMQSRLERLERDLTFMQRQVYKGGASVDPNAAGAAYAPTGANAGNLQVKITQLEEEMRALRGQIEQVDYRSQQAAQEVKRLSEDVDFRLRAIEEKMAAQPVAAMEPEAAAAPAAEAMPATAPEAATPQSEGFDVNAPGPQSGVAPAAAKGFANAREHYNYAFMLLNQAKYEESAASFRQFLTRYPKDPLVANAHYWIGESHYARRDYTKAAESFRSGFEAAPKGQKAADNLLKLSLSLANIKRTQEACIVLKQITAKYGTTAKTTAQKAESEIKRLNCA